MKKLKIIIPLLCVICIVSVIIASLPSLAANIASESNCEYVYTFNIKVDNPCNSSDMDRDAVNILYFDYYYNGQNGYQSEQKKTFDMSWNGDGNNNAEFLGTHFMRPNDDTFYTKFNVTLKGKLNRVYIKLNMDGGERLTFTVEKITCNGKRINSNTDYVSSAYNDSTATIYCSMEKSIIDETNSPYFKDHENFAISEKELNKIVNNLDENQSYAGQFKDQYNSVIDLAVLKNCVATSDGDINQYYSHHDEESMYNYTFYFDVENPINLNSADYNEVETFYIEISYVDQNGYGSGKKYKLDMAYSSDLKRNLNQKYLNYFERYNDTGYKTHFSLWVPGIVTEVKCKLNMRGEKLCVNFEKIVLNSMSVNTDRDYVSSVYYDSDATIPCYVPASQIAVAEGNLPEKYSTELTDQYGAVVSENLFNKAKADPQRYLYHQ